MALEARLNELKLKHKEMEAKITNESKFASADHSEIGEFKRTKMKLKEEISDIEARMAS